MKCSHCLTEFHSRAYRTNIAFNDTPYDVRGESEYEINFWAVTNVCPKCFGPHVYLASDGLGRQGTYDKVHPRVGAFDPPPPEVPEEMANDYREANEVLTISPKASAALSRRCLQDILKRAGYASSNLASQVGAVINEESAAKSLPPDIRDSLDAIRNFGNFSAHPINDTTTLQIIDVEAGEAEWCLQILQELFQHYFVRPARAAERRAALNQKLAAAGKPPMKAFSSNDEPDLTDDEKAP